MKSAPLPEAAELERHVDVEITDEELSELSALVNEALKEIETGETAPIESLRIGL